MGAWYSIYSIQNMKDVGCLRKTLTYAPKVVPMFFGDRRGGGQDAPENQVFSPMECVMMIDDAGMFQHRRAQTNTL